MSGGGFWNDYGACELEYNYTLLLAYQQHRMVAYLFQFKQRHSEGRATSSLNTHLSLPS